MPFQPKQITRYQAEHLAELQGDVSEQAIRFTLDLFPPFSAGDVIHDNACGSGAVTETIMDLPPPSVHIDATDVNEHFAQGVAALAAQKQWPVSTAVIFAFHCLGDHHTAARQVYRTLKPGGITITSILIFMPHIDPSKHAHWRTRGRDGHMPTLLPIEGFQEADLRKALEVGGFLPENITCSTKDCYLQIPDLKCWAQLAWSYLGVLPTEWTQHDEDKWDEAIADIVEELKIGDGISQNEKRRLC